MTGLLASVSNLGEARLAAAAGADIIDLKAPRAGALGALPVSEVLDIVKDLRGAKPISATVGDLPMDPPTVLQAVQAMAATGVDYVKIGFFPGGDWEGSISTLAREMAADTRLIAVLFADQNPDLRWLDRLAEAGFAGAMLDTMDKGRGSLTDLLKIEQLGQFTAQAQSRGLLCGLAGSLRSQDISDLMSLDPDYLGFRGALCRGAQRIAEIDITALENIRARMRRTPTAA